MRRSFTKSGGMPVIIMTRQAHVRYMATTRPAISMSKALRQAAARDPGLEWDAQAHRYRLRRRTTPSPTLANGDSGEGGGGQKVKEATASRPAAQPSVRSNTHFCRGFGHE